jgi:hypothetical protein
MQPILNLKRLNVAHLDTPYFRMGTGEDVRHALSPGDWAASIDLRDAYFHVPLHEEVHELRMERPPISFLHPSFWLIPSAKGFHGTDQVHQGAFQPSPLLFISFSDLGHQARGILIYSLVAFLPRYGLSAAYGGIRRFYFQ